MSADAIAKEAEETLQRNDRNDKKSISTLYSTAAGVSSNQKIPERRHFPNKMSCSNIFGDPEDEDKDGTPKHKEDRTDFRRKKSFWV